MELGKFLYRQKQRIKIRTSSSVVDKNVALINFEKRKVETLRGGFFISELNLTIPDQFGFVFEPKCYPFLISNAQHLNGFYTVENENLIFHFNEIQISVTSRSELYIINEIFVEKCYQFYLPINEKVQVIDLGMNVGVASLFFASLPFVTRVHSYEPFVPTYLQAKENLDRNKVLAQKIEVHNFGLGKFDGELTTLYNPDNKGINSSVVVSPRIHSGQEEKLTIKSTRNCIGQILAESPNCKFVIKIDTEGAEYDIMDSLFSEQLSQQVVCIMLEWHFKGSQGLEEKLLQNMFKVFSTRLNENSGLIYAFR